MFSAKRVDNVGVAFWDYGADDFVIVNGLTQSSFQYNIPKEGLNVLGSQTSGMITSGPIDTSLSISKNMTVNDNLLSHTGRSDMKFHITTNMDTAYSTSGISLSGAIQSVSVSAAVGEVPTLSAEMILDTTNFFTRTSVDASAGIGTSVYIPSTGIQLNIGGQNGNNAISSASFAMNFNWIKEARVNNPTSGQRFILELVRPIEYQASVELIVDDYLMDVFGFTNPKTWELKLYSDAALVHTLTMENAELIGESVNLNSQGLQTVTLQYRGVG